MNVSLSSPPAVHSLSTEEWMMMVQEDGQADMMPVVAH